MSKKYLWIIIIIHIFCVSLFSDETGKNKKKEASITIGNTVLSLEQAIDIVIKQNLTLQSAKYDVMMSDSAYEKAQKKYSTNLNLEGGYLNQETPPSVMTSIAGNKLWQWDAAASLSKQFSSGTTIAAGVKEMFFDYNDKPTGPGRSPDPAYHRPALFVSIQQELLKNAFGSSDRKQNAMLKKQAQIQRATLIDKLSNLVVSTLTDYWNVTIQKTAMETSRATLDANLTVRGIITRNAKFGLSEAYDVNQYNSLVATSESNLQAAEQRYREAVRKLLRTINMPAETEVTGVTDLIDELPVLNSEEALKVGFAKRADYKNALIALENAKMDLDMQENNALPSLTLSGSLTNQGQGQSDELSKAHNEAANGEYQTWQVRAKLTYPLDDSEAKTNVRDAKHKLKQAEITLKNLKLEIKDDIINKLEQVNVQHQMLVKARIASREAQIYYKNILRRFEQGKVNSLTIKTATDYMVQSRQQELNSLVQFNIAILLFDLAKNEVFERYNIDVETYLKDIK